MLDGLGDTFTESDTSDTFIRKHDAATGKQLWRTRVGLGGTRVVVRDGMVYLGVVQQGGGAIMALRDSDGQPVSSMYMRQSLSAD